MTLRTLFLSILLVVAIKKGHTTTVATDTTQLGIDLDSAFNLMKKLDPKALPWLTELLAESRKQEFKRGEAEALFCIGEFHSLSERLDTSWLYFDSARIKFEALNIKGRLAQSLNMLGSVRIMQNQYAASVTFFEKAAVINKAAGRKRNLGDCYYNLAHVHSVLGEYVKALEYYFLVLKLDEEIDFKEGMADDYGNIGAVYEKIGDIPKAIENELKAIEIAEASGSKHAVTAACTKYGLLLKNTGRFSEARLMLERALKVSREMNFAREIASTLHNMGALYYAERNYSQAIRMYNESLALKVRNAELVNYEGLAQAYLKLRDFSNATRFAAQSLVLANDSKNMDAKKRLHLLLADIASTQGNYKLSLEHYKQYTVFKDSLLDSEKSRQIQDMQAKYENDQKESAIAALTQERELQDASIRQKTIVQYGLIIGLVVLIAFGVITFRIFRGRQEARRQLLDQQLKNEHQETERVKELDKLKSRFFANIAHEFRTPLTLILGPVENLINDSKQTSERDQLALVKNNASRLVKLVNQLLDLSKLEAGAVKFDYVQEDIVPFLKSITFAFQSLADQKRISIEFNSEPSVVVTRFDRDKLEKIFSNLLSNAFKFTPEDGRVVVDVSMNNDRMTVRVTDSGHGITSDDLPYIFNRFYQSGKSSRSTTGSGIGLELTKELVEICGGNIRVSNVPSGGAQFQVELPVVLDNSISDQKKHSYSHTALALEDARGSAPSIGDVSTDSNELVLVIEDNQEVRDFIVSSLNTRYKVVTAEHGGEGIAKALEIVPDLIITDVMMPVKDGLEVCRTLKEAQETSHIPVIMLTAKADVESRIEGLETGADDYLAKPFNTRELLTRIQNLIDIRHKLQQKFRTATPEPKDAEVVEELPARERLFLNRLHEAIELHLAEEEYSVEELSRDMAMSRMQLHRKIKALTNTSASLYIRSIRLARGKQLLEEGLYNVSEVAYRVGFNSPTYFSTCFSEEYGFAPSEIKRTVDSR